MLRNVTPAIAVYQVQLDNKHILLGSPLALADVWVKMVVPPLTTLLSDAAGKALGDLCPILGSTSGDNLSQDLIFARRPSGFREVATVYEL